MSFRQGAYAKIWKLENKGNYHVAEMSTSKKNKQTDTYETDWANKFVRLVGAAHEKADSLDLSKSVKIGACEVTNRYSKENNTTYTNYAIFSFEDSDSTAQKQAVPAATTNDGFMSIPDGVDEELPFN